MFEIFFAAYEKLVVFRWSFLIVLGIFVASLVYIRLVLRYYKDEFKSIEWTRANSFKSYVFVAFPSLIIAAPTLEELIFRAPLLLFFDGLSPASCIFSIIFSIFFGATHWHSPVADGMRIADKTETDDLLAEAIKTKATEPRSHKISRVSFTFVISLVLSYLALSSQSIWPSLIFHSAWNFIWPLIGPIVFTLLVYFALYVYDFMRMIPRKIMKFRRQNGFSTKY